MARLLGKPFELVEFHVWYLKAKGWVERLDTGQLAISALGVDQVEKDRLRLRKSTICSRLPRARKDRRRAPARRRCFSFRKTLI